MNYDPVERNSLDRDVEINDICDFFKDFMLNNRLGQIANLHVALADFNIEGVKSSDCIRLAKLVRSYILYNIFDKRTILINNIHIHFISSYLN